MFRRSDVKIFSGVILFVLISTAGYFFLAGNGFQNGKVEYENSEFGFKISLPENWRGYTISIDKWTGYVIGDRLGEKVFTDGPVVSIHNPEWKGINSYQDIPVMVFTIDQWNDLQSEKFHIGAAPIGPSELGRNSRYIFALPARYNYAFPPGYEEVDRIIQSHPLKAF